MNFRVGFTEGTWDRKEFRHSPFYPSRNQRPPSDPVRRGINIKSDAWNRIAASRTAFQALLRLNDQLSCVLQNSTLETRFPCNNSPNMMHDFVSIRFLKLLGTKVSGGC